MRIAWIALAAMLAAAAPAEAAVVQVMVVGRQHVLRGPARVTLKPRTVRVGGRRCTVARGTPLSVLAATRLPLRIRDQGRCGRAARDSASLYVTQIGPDRARGRSGWVYKIGHRAGTAGAGDAAGPFGSGGLRGGARVLWFWCTLDSADGCQRTLDVRAPARVAPGAPVRARVRGYDDRGRGVPVAGATVRLGDSSAVTGADGSAVVTAPARPGRVRLTAERAGMAPGFPAEVRVR